MEGPRVRGAGKDFDQAGRREQRGRAQTDRSGGQLQEAGVPAGAGSLPHEDIHHDDGLTRVRIKGTSKFLFIPKIQAKNNTGSESCIYYTNHSKYL